MNPWKVGDVAIAVRDATCGCGEHHVKNRATYRVAEIGLHPVTEQVYLRVQTVDHFFKAEYFRREQPCTEDVFRLAKAPKPELTPA